MICHLKCFLKLFFVDLLSDSLPFIRFDCHGDQNPLQFPPIFLFSTSK